MDEPPHADAPPAAEGASKAERYFQGAPFTGPERPLPQLPDELAHGQRTRLNVAGALGLTLAVGLLLGFWLAPETPKSAEQRLAQLERALVRSQAQVTSLEQQLTHGVSSSGGKLARTDRLRHEREGHRYALSLKRSGAQAAADLMEWFVKRWNELLDAPQDDDRATRRAATLALLVGGMAANINPGDYVPWQAEFWGGNWLGDLHFDLDGDGLPGHRADENRHDGFANVSICQVAMALNQSMRDAQVLVMPELRCDRPESRMSVFLQGRTFNDALDEFVAAVKAHGFIVLEKSQGGMRLVLVGEQPKTQADGDE